MRFSFACAALSACVFAAGTARAQTSTGTGSCTGTLAGTVGLSVLQSGSVQTVQAASIGTVYGNAECECPPPANEQINLEIKLTTALPISTAGTVEVWVGPNCDTFQNRTTGTPLPCQKITSGAPTISTVTTGSADASSLIEIPISGADLMSPSVNGDAPNPAAQVCTTPTLTNSIYLFVFTTDSQNPSSTCTLPLTEENQLPAAVTNVSAGSGDSSVDLQWTLPPVASTSPTGFQILCTDDCGNQIKSSPPAPFYSTCINGVLHRRTLSTGGTTPTGTDDGGVTTTDDAGTSLIGPATPNASTTVGTEDATVTVEHCDGTDGGITSDFPSDMGASGPLTNLNPMYTCSGQLSATSNSARITGLKNNTRYHFIVLSTDNFGNATPSAVLDAIPLPTEDLYRRYRDAGGAAGGCFIATAAFGSYESGWVYILRDFRDRVLLPTTVGHSFVDWYYANSPPAAAWIAERSWARAVTRTALLPVIAGAFFWVYFAAWQKALFMTLLFALALRKRIAAALVRGQRA
jgi:hypothetical protein